MYFQFLKEYFKASISKASIDNEFCKFHYRYTTIILLASCVLVGTKEIFGHDIKCDVTGTGFSEGFLDAYCYYQYVYTVVSKSDHGQPSTTGVLLGLGVPNEHQEKRYHVYYQWVATVLFLQALVFYLPHYFWKKVEGERIKTLVDGLELARYAHEDEELSCKDVNIPSRSKVRNKLNVIKKDIVLRFHSSCSWATGLVLCEVANLLNVILQVYLTNVFLDGLFLRVGYVAAESNFVVGSVLYPPMNKIFPKVAGCTYVKSAQTGEPQPSGVNCVLQQNNTNDKIFTALWYWYIILFIVSCTGVLWRLSTVLLYKTPWFNRAQFNRRDNPKELYEVASLCHFSDWLFLSYIHKNTSRAIFTDIVSSVASELHERYDVRPSGGIGFENTLPLKCNVIYGA